MSARKYPAWAMTPEARAAAVTRLKEIHAELNLATAWLGSRGDTESVTQADRLHRAASWVSKAIDGINRIPSDRAVTPDSIDPSGRG